MSTCDSYVDVVLNTKGIFFGTAPRPKVLLEKFEKRRDAISYPTGDMRSNVSATKRATPSSPGCRLTIVHSRLVFLARPEAKLRRVCCFRGWKLYANRRHRRYKGCSGM